MRHHWIAIAAQGLLTAIEASAADALPPIKPGLWRLQSERLVDGQKAPDLSEQLKSMPPEVRQRMADNMRQHGIDLSDSRGQMTMCLTRESLDQGQWQGSHGGCKTNFTSRSASGWAWHSSCAQPPAESDGVSVFHSPESYSVKTTTTMTLQGRTQVTTMALAGQWLGADCGPLKPLKPQREVVK